ncbi:MAG: hypothetical protein J7525_14130 [Roseofilum sp. SID3]|uniref:hypothetical protein n=1 Tax=Roseofilum sp. SID3 TaxID=2821499 RepID=UPI001B271C3A|nr:hypothetical protein [Roseofilum sp. SID3]MBP0014231.1 hypothetical protein [Roseofilum sp. SID3]
MIKVFFLSLFLLPLAAFPARADRICRFVDYDNDSGFRSIAIRALGNNKADRMEFCEDYAIINREYFTGQIFLVEFIDGDGVDVNSHTFSQETEPENPLWESLDLTCIASGMNFEAEVLPNAEPQIPVSSRTTFIHEALYCVSCGIMGLIFGGGARKILGGG